MIRALTTVGLLGAFLLAASPARADDAAQAFGDKGEIIVSADRVMGLFDYTSFKTSSTTMGVTSSTSVNFTSIALLQNPSSSVLDVPANTPRLSFDYTVVPHLTLGGRRLGRMKVGETPSACTLVKPCSSRQSRLSRHRSRRATCATLPSSQSLDRAARDFCILNRSEGRCSAPLPERCPCARGEKLRNAAKRRLLRPS